MNEPTEQANFGNTEARAEELADTYSIRRPDFGLTEFMAAAGSNYTVLQTEQKPWKMLHLIRQGDGRMEADAFDVVLSEDGNVKGIKRAHDETDPITRDRQRVVMATILGEDATTYRFDRSKSSSGGENYSLTISKKPMVSLDDPVWGLRFRDLTFGVHPKGPDDVEIEYTKDADIPLSALDTLMDSSKPKPRIHTGEAGRSVPIPREAVTRGEDNQEEKDQLTASWGSSDGRSEVIVEFPPVISMEDGLKVEAALRTKTDWMNLPRELPIVQIGKRIKLPDRPVSR